MPENTAKCAHISSQRLQSHDDGPSLGDLGNQRIWSPSCYDCPHGDACPHVSHDAHGGHIPFLIKIQNSLILIIFEVVIIYDAL